MPPDSPLPIAAVAGNRKLLALSRADDPVVRALSRLNDKALTVPPPTITAPPTQDGVAYPVEGTSLKYCRPELKVGWRKGWKEGPMVLFEGRDDGSVHLLVALDEDPSKRAAGAVPFPVKIISARLVYGAGQLLDFAQPLQEPGDPAAGPAFRITLDAAIPDDENRARLLDAMQRSGSGAEWIVKMEYQFTHTRPPPPVIDPDPDPGPIRPHPREIIDPVRPLVVNDPRVERELARPLREAMPASAARRFLDPNILRRLNDDNDIRVIDPNRWRPTVVTETLTLERHVSAEFPPTTAENQSIFATVSGQGPRPEWRATANGWISPTDLLDTVYCLPDAYLLALDTTSGMPSVQALLLPSPTTPSGGAEKYITRLTMRAVPFTDLKRLDGLRPLVRALTDNDIEYANFVLGGYDAARFIPDESLAGQGSLFSGTDPSGKDVINPAAGFTVTYQGDVEFIQLIYDRLKGPGIGGDVELDLKDPSGGVQKHRVPVILSVQRLAPLDLPQALTAPPTPPSSPAAPAAPAPIVQSITVQNPSRQAVQIDEIRAYGLLRSANLRRADAYYPATVDDTLPLTLDAQASHTVSLHIDDADALPNAWDVALIGCRPLLGPQALLDSIFDAAGAGVRGWKVAVDCPPLKFWDQLTPEQQAPYKDVIAVEVQLRRKGGADIESARLSRQQPEGTALLSRTVADFISDRATGRSELEYRSRLLRIMSQDPWPATWQGASGNALSVYFT